MSAAVGSEVPNNSETEAVRFDFRNRADLGRDHIRRVEIAHETFARQTGRQLSSLLRVKIHLDPPTTRQVSLGDYVRALPNPAVVGMVELAPLPGTVLVGIQPETAFNLVSLMLGGRRGGVDVRRPTEIETSLLQLLLERALEPLAATFEPLVPVTPQLAGFEFNPLLITVPDSATGALLLTYELHVDGDGFGQFTLTYPLPTLEPVGEVLRQEEPDEPEVPDTPGPLVNVLPRIELPITVRLSPVTMPASDLLELEPGDVIRLSHRIDEPVLGVVDDWPLAEGRIGRSGSQIAFQFSNWRVE